MISGFIVADDRNAGGFWDGLDKIFDFPAEVVNEAVEKVSGLPALLVKFMPSLIETINIALVSTLVGALLGGILSLAATRGFAQWPHLIPVWRRILDVMRAMPEIVIALILIFDILD